MNKFQKLYTKIANRLMPNPERDPDMYNFLKEIKEKLVDEPTLEEVQKEWKALGYKFIYEPVEPICITIFKVNNSIIRICNNNNGINCHTKPNNI